MESPKDNMNENNASGTGCESMKAYTIGGVPIIFPYRAYPSRITMMDKIVKCLNKKFNCLLESPTGSGKSLALLCACLAWQKKTRKAIQELEEALDLELNARGTSVPDVEEKHVESSTSSVIPEINSWNCKQDGVQCCSATSENGAKSGQPDIKSMGNEKSKRGIVYFDEDDLEDFKPSKKHRCSDSINHNNPLQKQFDYVNEVVKPQTPSVLNTETSGFPNSSDKKDKLVKEESSVPLKLPKIYFGTRTHKQIEQIIRELKKTAYKNSKITILSSRDRTCIHPEASKAENKTEACNELLKHAGGPACKYFRKSKTISHYHPSELSSAFDLEDFVKICKSSWACPYYSSRELLPFSDIIFCPYNYFIDPLIRSTLSINLKGSILIMDEAHNIEDSARSAASCSISLMQFEESVIDLEKIGRNSESIPECYKCVAKVLSNLASWIKGNLHNLSDYTTFDSSAKVWAGDDLIAVLRLAELGPDAFPDFKKKVGKILEEQTGPEEGNVEDLQENESKLLGSTITVLKNLTQVLLYVYKNELLFISDYRLVIMKTNKFSHSSSLQIYNRRRNTVNNPVQITLNFWCLNSAVAFSDIKDVTHSVIVASGTLSPLTSFESELSLPFQISLEANHVVSKAHVWAGTIGKGPNDCTLNASYRNAATFSFQDDIGCLVFQVCGIISHGILCFLPSYSMLDRLVNRWQQTGMWDKLLTRKVVLCEPRKQNDFQEVISEFYEAIDETEHSCNDSKNGALLLAVCRGKVSEGIDFSDNYARAVITIGIPFPSFKEAEVDLKKKYNDMHASKKMIMTGSEWYEVQAFRALNQALGRCIRHRNDYGALIIVDERFQKNNRYPQALSKWIRKDIEHFPNFSDFLNSLIAFAERMGLRSISDAE